MLIYITASILKPIYRRYLSVSYVMVVVLGIIQGVAEFLPISSSGHLTLFQHFFGMPEPDNLFNILLHFATLIAVFVYYWQDIWEMIVEFFRFLGDLFSRNPSRGEPPAARRQILLLIVATLPLFLILPIKARIEAVGNYPAAVSCILLLTGVVLFLSDRMARGHKNARNTTLKDALLIGVAQCFATLPGLSRSGSTIAAGMALGLDRKFAVRFSFLMSLPAVLGATLLEVVDVIQAGAIQTELLPKYLLGMLFAGVVGYFSIGLVNLLAAKGKFGAFAYYCWIAGVVFLILSVTGFTFVPAA